LGGTEDVLRQFLATIDRLLPIYNAQAIDLDNQALASHALLLEYGHYQKGSRKPSSAEFTDAIRSFPRNRFQSLIVHQVIEVYQSLREGVTAHLNEVKACRERLDAAVEFIKPAVPDELLEVAATVRRLMPPGCLTIGDAVERFVKVLTPEDYQQIDRRVQRII